MDIESIVCDPENLYEASKRVLESGPKKQATAYFKQKRLAEIRRAQDELHSRTWKIKPMRPFMLNERGHRRKIVGNTPYDRMIIHSYLDFGLEPLLRKYLIYDNYASQKGKGTDLARRKFKEFCHRAYRECGHNRFYVLLIDFAKFYDNVQHEKLKRAILNKIPYDPFHEYMIDTILNSMQADVSYMTDEQYAHCLETKYSSLDHLDEEVTGKRFMAKGLQIGNQASQLFSIFYPASIDTFCRCVMGARLHGRYMDDTFIVHEDKDFLRRAIAETTKRCEKLGIYVHERKTQIYRIDKGVKYLNRVYTMSETGKLYERLHKSTVIRQKRKLRKFKRMLEDGSMTYERILNHHRTWMGSFDRAMTRRQKNDICDLYNKLFIDDFAKGGAT